MRAGRLPRIAYRVARDADNLSLRALDVGIVAAAWMLGYGAGFELQLSSAAQTHAIWFIGVPIVVQALVNHLAGLYGPVWEYASIEEGLRVVAAVASGVIASVAVLAVVSYTAGFTVPLLTAPPVAALLMLLGCGGIRFQSRLFALERMRSSSGQLHTVIVGAGGAGAALAHELTTTESGKGLEVVGFVDDDPKLVGRSLRGRPVLGVTGDLPDICEDHAVDRILIAMPEASHMRTKEVVSIAISTGAQVKLLETASDRVNGPLVRSIRDLDVTDLLGRDHAPVDTEEIGHYLEGATVLITGAGGSIGTEIADQVARYRPGQLLLLDRDESLLHDTIHELSSPATPLLVDIRDRRRLEMIFELHRPDVVFHAAAHKHVPMLESHPVEAVRTNVLGTWWLATTAARYGCGRFVHISTDKAADPCSIMGATKRAAEQIVFALGRNHGAGFVAVRFGNVLGSRGSVVPTFLRQILAGGPVTVTDPEMTRYFMTIPEAVSLVLQSGAMADRGRIFLLEMGEPVPILSLAHQMIRLSGLRLGEDIEISITGPRPGERLHERLHDEAEVIEAADHPAIFALTPKVDLDFSELCEAMVELEQRCDEGDPSVVVVLEDLLRRGGVDCRFMPPHQATVDQLVGRVIDLRDSARLLSARR